MSELHSILRNLTDPPAKRDKLMLQVVLDYAERVSDLQESLLDAHERMAQTDEILTSLRLLNGQLRNGLDSAEKKLAIAQTEAADALDRAIAAETIARACEEKIASMVDDVASPIPGKCALENHDLRIRLDEATGRAERAERGQAELRERVRELQGAINGSARS